MTKTEFTAIPATERTKFANRFWSFIQTGNRVDCWPWIGDRRPNGYGYLDIEGTKYAAHRAIYILVNGALSAQMVVCHACDNPWCCNPGHLWAGTQADNIWDRDAKNRRWISRGKGAWKPHFTDREAVMVLSMVAIGGFGHRELAAKFKVSEYTIMDLIYVRRYKHIDRSRICGGLLKCPT